VSVGIDSMILVYAGFVPSKSREISTDFQELQVRSKLLLHQLSRRKVTILLPTIAISELLVPVPKAQKGALAAALTDKFVCPTFDLAAASIAADLWSQHKKLPQDSQYGHRHVLRADAMIVASAHAAGATEFFSHDRRCRALADLVMTAYDLPKSDPEDMFLEGDIRRGDL
jgi:predicted nucleic acid-binding protein